MQLRLAAYLNKKVEACAGQGIVNGGGVVHRVVVHKVAATGAVLMIGLWANFAAGALAQADNIPVIRMNEARVIVNDSGESRKSYGHASSSDRYSNGVMGHGVLDDNPPKIRMNPAPSEGRPYSDPVSLGQGTVLVETSQPNVYRTEGAVNPVTRSNGAHSADQVALDKRQSAPSSASIDPQNPLWELYNQVQVLAEEVRHLRGMVESSQNATQQLDRKQKQNYVDLDERLTVVEQTAGLSAAPAQPFGAADMGRESPVSSPEAAPGGAGVADQSDTLPAEAERKLPVSGSPKVNRPTASRPLVKASPPPLQARLSEKDAYEKVYDRLQAREFAAAKTGFQNFLADYPAGQFAGSALYWLGELSLRQKEPDEQQALSYIERLIAEHPDHARIPDALYKQATLKYRQQEVEEAREIFEKILREHPGTTAARLADHQLKRIDGSL